MDPERLQPVPPDFPRGVKLLHDPVRNKGTAFREEERDLLGLRGLLPPRVFDLESQMRRVMGNLRQKTTDLERYIFLVSLQDRNETLFYRVLTQHLAELMPIVYTPTVGKACQLFGHIFRRPRGLFVTADDEERFDRVLANWPHDDVRMIVLTDGERILGLGDLGADGMGIPVGKLSLYTACAGLHPTRCLPMTLDVGTNNADLLKDPLYIGLQRPRLRGEDYDRVVDKLIQAIRGRFPRAVLQFEDFATENAFRLLRRYRDHLCCFNDDIQGTAAVTLAGLISANRLTGRAPEDLRVLFLGAGEAGTGIADLIVSWLEEQGMREGEARHRCWLFDSKGLVVQERTDLAPHKLAYAHGHEGTDDFLQAIEMLRPHAIIGVSGTPGTFTRPVLEKMAELNPRPIVFALSNPTSKSECTARQAYTHTGGRAIFASGSPFPPVDFDGRTFVPGQGNNAYVFPGVGLGAVVAESSRITDPMFLAAAKTLAGEVLDSDLALGRVYPSLSRIREVSAKIARSVAEVAFEAGLTDRVRMGDLDQAIHEEVFEPIYPQYA